MHVGREDVGDANEVDLLAVERDSMEHRPPHGRPRLVGASVAVGVPENQNIARLPSCDVHAAVVAHRKHPRLAQVLRKHVDGESVWNIETLNILRRAIEAWRGDDMSGHLN